LHITINNGDIVSTFASQYASERTSGR